MTCVPEPLYFAFDDVTLDEPARRAAERMAACLLREGSSRYTLIGRSDPRGAATLNVRLGERRAQTVRRYLEQLGVGAARFSVRSEGSRRASGYDEDTWRFDRRVELEREP